MPQLLARNGPAKIKDSLTLYLTEIGRESLLAREDEVELARCARAGDQEAIDRLVTANLRFVVKVATQFRNRGLPLEDLVCEGNVGLIKAAYRFDGTRGVRFISYAVWWIRQSILKALCDTAGIVRLPQYKAQEIKKVKRMALTIEREEQRLPTPEEIGERLGLTPEVVADDLGLHRNYISLDAPVSDDGPSSLLDFMKAVEDSPVEDRLTEEAMRSDVIRALSLLKPREARVIGLYFGLNGNSQHTLQAIGDMFGCTKENVRLIKEKALRRLRVQSRRHILEKYTEN